MELLLDWAPVALFFAAYGVATLLHWEAIYVAVGVAVVASVCSVALSLHWFGRVKPTALLSAALVVVMGGLTLYLHDERFIKVKPSILFGVMGLALIGAVAVGKNPMKSALDAGSAEPILVLTEAQWRWFNLQWACFFLGLAVLNLWVVQHYSTTTWVWYKSVGTPLGTVVFAVATMKYWMIQSDNKGKDRADDVNQAP